MSKKNLFVSIAVVLTAVVMVFAFTACISSDVNKVKEKLEKAGYTVEVIEDGLEDGAIGILEAKKGTPTSFDNIDGIYVCVFAKASDAKKYYDDNKEEIEESAKMFKDGKSGVQGKVIYAGSADAVKAAK
jgi:hypothetical protein